MCALKRRVAARTKPASEWKARAERVDAEILSDFSKASDPVSARCRRCGYEWITSPKNVGSGRGCPSCAGVVPVAQEEWDRRASEQGVEWLERVRSSHTKTAARCVTCGHEWRVMPSHVASGTGCPKCRRAAAAAKRQVPRATRDAEAAAIGMEWVDAPGGSKEERRIRCLTCGYVDRVTPASVVRGRLCKRCADRIPLTPATWDQRAAAAGLRWLEPVHDSQAAYPVQCLACGHTWSVRATNVTTGRGCPECAKRIGGLKRRASREQRDAEAAAVGIRWIEPPDLAGGKTLAECLTCHRQYRVTPNAVQSGARCAVCVGQLVTQDDWDRRAAAVGVRWLAPVKSRATPTPARCLKCGWEWDPWPSQIRDGGGCPKCAHYGLDPSVPGLLYLLVHHGLGLMKVGIMAQSSGRLRQHKRRGWEVAGTWKTETAARAAHVEDMVVDWWLASGCKFALREEVPAGDGFTETVHIGRLDVPDTLLAIRRGLAAAPETATWHKSVITPSRREVTRVDERDGE